MMKPNEAQSLLKGLKVIDKIFILSPDNKEMDSREFIGDGKNNFWASTVLENMWKNGDKRAGVLNNLGCAALWLWADASEKEQAPLLKQADENFTEALQSKDAVSAWDALTNNQSILIQIQRKDYIPRAIPMVKPENGPVPFFTDLSGEPKFGGDQ